METHRLSRVLVNAETCSHQLVLMRKIMLMSILRENTFLILGGNVEYFSTSQNEI